MSLFTRANLKYCRQLLLVICAFTLLFQGYSQVLNPSDPIVVYNPAAPPTQPTWGQIGKWVKSNRLNWNTSSFKSYIYKGTAFRLKFPKTYQHNVADGKKYPIYVFFHGRGESGTIFDNEFQLYHGGQTHSNAVDNGSYDGFLLYIQNTTGWFGTGHYDLIKELIENFFVPQIKVDIDRVAVDGLSAGGGATWDFALRHPKLAACALPISSATTGLVNELPKIQYIPIWHFQGQVDRAPAPSTSWQIRDRAAQIGANYRYKEYAGLGHGVWNNAWAEADYFPFLNRAHKANPWPLFGRTDFCPGDAVSATLGLTAGFDGYEWRKDGVVIGGATTNTLAVTSFGTYDARIRRGTVWSAWSPIPVVVKEKGTTISPDISIQENKSRVIPAPDGSTGVNLSVPEGYATYRWEMEGNPTVLSSTNTLLASSPGIYKVRVTEFFGCSSDFSTPYTVLDANGPNKPDQVSNLVVSPTGKTELRLNWSDNPTPINDESAFEIYRSSKAGGPYSLVGTVGANVLTFTNTGLAPNTPYFYLVRAIGQTSAALASVEASGTTLSDVQPPSAPANLRVVSSTRNSISLVWEASTDDVGVGKYEIYSNGVKTYVSSEPSFTVFNLAQGATYNFAVKAKDLSGNLSAFSNQVTAQAKINGLSFKYYTTPTAWSNLPDFNKLIPVVVGNVPNVSIADRTQPDGFGYLWEGFIQIPVNGAYQFRTRSDDGSRLWLGSLNGLQSPYSFAATPLVNNDGLHGAQDRTSATVNLTAGIYPIAIAFFEATGGDAMSISWSTPLTSGSFVAIPNSAFSESIAPGGPAPLAPTQVVASAAAYNRVNLSWQHNGAAASGFEIWRSTSFNTGFSIINTINSSSSSFVDNTVAANTVYFYRVRAIGQFGESAFAPVIEAQVNWKFDNNYVDASGNSKGIAGANSPVFSSDKFEGSHSIQLNGTNQELTPTTAAGDYSRGAYTSKTVMFWMKANATTNGTNRIGVFDLGGADNGLAMHLQSNQLFAGIASNNVRRQISVPFTSLAWTHIALVYNSNSLQLFVNGVEVASNNDLGFTTVNATTNGSRIGRFNGTNAFNATYVFFNGRFDDFVVIGRALSASEVAFARTGSYGLATVTTPSLPTIPGTPTNLEATSQGTNSIGVTWNDIATNENAYELYRSANINTNFLLYKTLPANTNSYTDIGLFANAKYFYKVRAINDGGNSEMSNEDDALTGNNLPILGPIATVKMRFDGNVVIPIAAVDEDGGNIGITFTNLPSFASFTSTGNGTGNLVLNNPGMAGLGTYSDLIVTATDATGGVSSVSFSIVVNDNFTPVINNIADVIVAEKQLASLSLTADDQNASDNITWQVTGLPSFVTVTEVGRSLTFNFQPGYSDHGSYNINVAINDGNEGTDNKSFVLTVADVNPNRKLFINFTDGSQVGAAPWNNTNKVPALNDAFNALKDEKGATTSIGLTITSSWQLVGNGTNVLGANTGNNSGVYPDAVIRSAYWTNASPQSIRINGLSQTNKYNFTFFGSRGSVSDNRTTTYTIGGQSVSLNAAANTRNVANLNNLVANPDNTLSLGIQAAAGSSFGYLNAMVIEELYDDGSAPAKARNLSGVFVNGRIQLTWLDAAYNEASYQVYRSGNLAGPFDLLNGSLAANSQAYSDESIIGNATYYYYLTATNIAGVSPSSDTIAVTIPNVAPNMPSIANVIMKTGQTRQVVVNATDAVGDAITLSASNLPTFVSFIDNGGGSGTFTITPGSTTGVFQGVTVTARDQNMATSSRQFSITITPSDITSLFVNFNQVNPVSAPWNSFSRAPAAGSVLSNLVDEASQPTGVSISLVDGWEGANDVGGVTGNNSGVFPDAVMQTAYFFAAAGQKRVRISGLPQNGEKYNLVFFASRVASDNRNTVFSAAGQSVTLNAASNTSQTVQINGLVPNASGQIEFTVEKGAGSPFAYINALVIQSYLDNGLPIAPSNLKAASKSKSVIELTWQDKADNETEFEVFRSNTANGTFTLLATLGANVTSFVNDGLPANTQFYYKVRAKSAAGVSAFSNTAGGSTIDYTVFMNFNRDNPAEAPWNNTDNVPQLNLKYENLKNELGNGTGIDIEVVENFSGENPFGVNTGNNSGIYPDNVIRSTWWLDYGLTAKLKLSGFNLSYAYSFTFFASRDAGGDRTTRYTINGQSVLLNAAFNRNQTVSIDQIRPNEDGEIIIEFSVPANSQYGYLGALVISGYTAPQSLDGVQPIVNETKASNLIVQATKKAAPSKTSNLETESKKSSNWIENLTASPNPFIADITVAAEISKTVHGMDIRLLDAKGQVVVKQVLGAQPKGRFNTTLNTSSNRRLPPGMYLLQVWSLDANAPPVSIRLLKIQ